MSTWVGWGDEGSEGWRKASSHLVPIEFPVATFQPAATRLESAWTSSGMSPQSWLEASIMPLFIQISLPSCVGTVDESEFDSSSNREDM